MFCPLLFFAPHHRRERACPFRKSGVSEELGMRSEELPHFENRRINYNPRHSEERKRRGNLFFLISVNISCHPEERTATKDPVIKPRCRRIRYPSLTLRMTPCFWGDGLPHQSADWFAMTWVMVYESIWTFCVSGCRRGCGLPLSFRRSPGSS